MLEDAKRIDESLETYWFWKKKERTNLQVEVGDKKSCGKDETKSNKGT
jgi:hypothetical protein